MQALILVATRGGPTMLARIGFMRALNRHVERVFNAIARTIIGESESWRAIGEFGRGVNVRSCSHIGLKLDIAACPKGANTGSGGPYSITSSARF
jgi:hypothetical protein